MSSPSFMSVQSLVISCEACRKYLPSVHMQAWFSVTMAVPAEPVKPEMKLRRMSQAARYSLCNNTWTIHSRFNSQFYGLLTMSWYHWTGY